MLQVITFDNWKDVARSNMYGCDQVGYSNGPDYEAYDSQCKDPYAFGFWAALYFTLVAILGTMVMLNLFIAVIITSMELLRESVKEEGVVWAKVKLTQQKLSISDSTVYLLVDLFEIVDVERKGKLTLDDLAPILDQATMTYQDKCNLYMTVDTDNSGQIDFAEFCELVYSMESFCKKLLDKEREREKHIAKMFGDMPTAERKRERDVGNEEDE
eukprot:CAMPEP_0182433802 /NCGR_PEP_ID=MMETSP1167-20130531/65685_1 /TAXON_ID=2988 /ORGANISM="Mallomonas Sp, Strain CCMP3275" /LENGTH=213 /DNA_ID=CAMNT_0024622929 /DNA_START=316 /DNA_END=957 /DNA_ORIENTATION=-